MPYTSPSAILSRLTSLAHENVSGVPVQGECMWRRAVLTIQLSLQV